jgi:hypothetical protein
MIHEQPALPVDDAGGPAPTSFLARCARAWDRFFFSAADPTTLGMVRICCGLIVVYTLIAYTRDLDSFFGKDAWYDLETRNARRATEGMVPVTWDWKAQDAPNLPPEVAEAANDPALLKDLVALLQKPLESGPELDAFEKKYPKVAGTILAFLEQNPQEADKIRLWYRGTPEWSIWFHVSDPATMRIVHYCFLAASFLFAIGLCTRVTSAITWFGMLSYINRSPLTIFGVDTMTSIALIYLMIGPSGAALSVDRLIWRWWATRRALRRESTGGDANGTHGGRAVRLVPLPVTPSVSANLAIRLLQIHVCIIYMAAGLSKLQGNFWWQGSAVWGTIANYEFGPMQYDWYMDFLKFLANNRFFWEFFMTTASIFTLFFEISFGFLVWHRKTRWLILAMAVTLHGGIGLFMGLKTFSMMMLTLVLSFVAPATIHRLLGALARAPGGMKLVFAGASPRSVGKASVVHALDIWSQVELVDQVEPAGTAGGRVELLTPDGQARTSGAAIGSHLFVTLGIFRIFAPWCWITALFRRPTAPAPTLPSQPAGLSGPVSMRGTSEPAKTAVTPGKPRR